MEFYSVKHREKIEVPDDQIYKVHYQRESKEGKDNSRYAVGAEVEHKGSKVKLTKFVSRAVYDELNVPERDGGGGDAAADSSASKGKGKAKAK